MDPRKRHKLFWEAVIGVPFTGLKHIYKYVESYLFILVRILSSIGIIGIFLNIKDYVHWLNGGEFNLKQGLGNHIHTIFSSTTIVFYSFSGIELFTEDQICFLELHFIVSCWYLLVFLVFSFVTWSVRR